MVQMVFAAAAAEASQVRVSGSLVFPVLEPGANKTTLIRLAERDIFLRNTSTGDVLEKSLTQLDGKFYFFVQKPGVYEVCWYLEYLGEGCSRPFTVKSTEVLLGNQVVDSKTPYVYGTSLMADARPCWFHDAFFNVNSFTQVGLISTAGTDVGNPVKANVAGEYV
jgi:hypothetical protein